MQPRSTCNYLGAGLGGFHFGLPWLYPDCPQPTDADAVYLMGWIGLVAIVPRGMNRDSAMDLTTIELTHAISAPHDHKAQCQAVFTDPRVG
jgi:hypothetical protein